jgi:hypothetical protein
MKVKPTVANNRLMKRLANGANPDWPTMRKIFVKVEAWSVAKSTTRWSPLKIRILGKNLRFILIVI